MEKNQTVTGIAAALGTNGEGIVKGEGYTLFVPYLLPGERAKIKILRVKGNVAYGKAEEIFTPADERVRPECSAFYRCGGCQLQHVKYRAQLKFKSLLVQDSLRKIGGIEYPVPACERSEKEYGYRNKLQLPIGQKDGENAIGFYAERSHRIVEIDECPIHPKWSRELIAALRRFMQTCGLDGYDEEQKTGQLRHIVVRELKGKFIVTLVSAVREIKGIDFLLHLLDDVFGEYTFYLNINDRDTNVVFGEEFILLKGQGVYDCTECGITFEAGANTFVQVNEGVRVKLYEKAVSLVVQSAEDTVIDCYAGGGLMTALFAKNCARAYGIEIVPEAVECAKVLAQRNDLADKMFPLCGRVEELLPEMLKKEPNAVVVLDPPRAGVDRSLLKLLAQNDVKKVVMISCNPATLARDLGILTGTLKEDGGELVKSGNTDGAYQITYLQPYDMFPQTKHVETLVCLKRK